MKKHLYILSALAALVACVPQEIADLQDFPNVQELTLKAYFDNVPTKSTLVDGTKVYWVPGDEIVLFSNKSAARFSSDIKEKAAECEFSGSIDAAKQYRALYPYRADAIFDGRVIRTVLPNVQNSTDGNVTNGLLYSAGVTSEDGSIRFRNLLSGICFTLESDDVKYVELKGNDHEAIAGDIQVTVDANAVSTAVAGDAAESTIKLVTPDGGYLKPGVTYYIVCVPTVFEKGISLVMYKEDGTFATFAIKDRVELKRSVFGRITSADKGLEFGGSTFPEGELPPDNEIWYTTIDDRPLHDSNLSKQGTSTVESHTFKDGIGVIRYSGPVTYYEGIEEPYNYETFEDLNRVTGILLPDCVERLGDQLIWDTYRLKEFRIPASVKEIERDCFVRSVNASLKRFTGHHVTEDGRCVILDGVLHGFAPVGLTSYEIPSGVTRLASASVSNTKDLKSLVLPSGLQDIEEYAVTNSGIESVTIPASVNSIHHYAFLDCLDLVNLLGDSHFISADRKFLYQEDDFFHPMILFFFAGKNDTSYEIPEGIQGIDYYAFRDCINLRSVTLPESMNYIAGDAFMRCENLESLLGSHTTSDKKGFVNEYGSLQFVIPSLGGDYVIPDEVTSLGSQLFHGRHNLTSVTMGDQVTSLGNYVFEWCQNLKTVTLSANLSSIGLYPFSMSYGLESVYFRSIVPPAYSDKQFEKIPSLKLYVPARAMRLYTTDSGWKDYWDVMEPYEYTDLPEPDFYLSSDYSREGEVSVYQRASKGNGIDIVFMGDAYSDREVESGKYINDMKAAAETYFNVEPYKSFRELFNIYFVTTVSATEGYARGGRSLGTTLGEGTYMSGDDAKCFELALKAVKDEKRMDEVLVVVCGSQDLSGVRFFSGTCFYYPPEDWTGRNYACGAAVAYLLKQDDSFEETRDLIQHEAGGHGFAKLSDEYYYPGGIQSRDKDYILSMAPYMWCSNVDVTSDPSKVKWSAFLADERYKYDGLGVFEGGYTYSYGVWRPSSTSIMGNNDIYFNAPSRYTIWYRIHKLAYGSSWNGTYEDFVEYDAINRKASASPSARPNMVELKHQRPHPPVMTGRSWREAE